MTILLKKLFRKRAIPYLIICVLLSTVAYQYLEIKNQQFNILYLYSYVPHVELNNIQYKSGDETLFYITGFVKFKDIDDQPKKLWQYQTIEPSERIDENGNRIYLLTDIIKLDYIPPRYFDPIELKEVQDTGSLISFTDEAGNIFRINKSTKEVSLQDITGDSTVLITSENDYQEFMKVFLQ